MQQAFREVTTLLHKPYDNGQTQTFPDGSPIELDPHDSVSGIVEGAQNRGNKWLRDSCRDFLGYEIDPPRMISRQTVMERNGMLWCSGCAEYHPKAAFSKDKRRLRGYRYWCKDYESYKATTRYHTTKLCKAG